MHTPRTVHRVQQPRHRSCSVSASTSAPLPREYALQEPRAEGRAIDPAAVERMFDATLGAHISPRELEQIWRGPPDPPADRAWPDPAGAWYCTGIHWAQQRDDTVAVVVRCETTPLQVVAVDRIQRRPWPEMAAHVGALLDAFPGPAAHDTTGAGNAIGAFPALAPTTSSRASRWSGVSGPTCSGTTLGPSNGTRSSVLGSTRAIPSTCTAGKTICSGAGIRPRRSSPWRWPITPSRRAGDRLTRRRPVRRPERHPERHDDPGQKILDAGAPDTHSVARRPAARSPQRQPRDGSGPRGPAAQSCTRTARAAPS